MEIKCPDYGSGKILNFSLLIGSFSFQLNLNYYLIILTDHFFNFLIMRKSTETTKESNRISRRKFIENSGIGLAGAAAVTTFPNVIARPAVNDIEIKVGVIGCGGRGTGAALDVLNAATKIIYPLEGYHTEDAAEGAKVQAQNIKLVALADVFTDRLNACRSQLKKVGVEIEDKYCFVGFEAYQKLLDIDEINYVIITSPPHFHPVHLRAAIEANKNAFVEKPASADVAGSKSVIESGEMAKQKGLAIGAGTNRRRDNISREVIRRIHDGEIGKVKTMYTEFLIGELWSIDREPGWSDMEFQLRNWLYYTYLGGDLIVEQFVHTLDAMNWVNGSHPTKAIALGGRQVRTDPKFGNIYDHMSVQYEYPDGVLGLCMDRQINGCTNRVMDLIIGCDGKATMGSFASVSKDDGDQWRFRGDRNNAYQVEHEEIIQSIRDGNPVNEARQVAESTLTAILGREAAYSGREISWDELMKSNQDFSLAKYELGDMPMPPVAMPGKYKFV
jgi:predicted dehydrogenase